MILRTPSSQATFSSPQEQISISVLGWRFRAQRQQQLEELGRGREYRYEVIDFKTQKKQRVEDHICFFPSLFAGVKFGKICSP
jgi:hypothetical protein